MRIIAADMQPLVPELYVSSIAQSLSFYCDLLGFQVEYRRPEDGFAFLSLGEAELMIEEPSNRTWLMAPLEQPYGRGINLQITVSDVDGMYDRLKLHGLEPLVPLETRRYRRDKGSITVRQFVLADPDGYLLRFSETIETRLA